MEPASCANGILNGPTFNPADGSAREKVLVEILNGIANSPEAMTLPMIGELLERAFALYQSKFIHAELKPAVADVLYALLVRYQSRELQELLVGRFQMREEAQAWQEAFKEALMLRSKNQPDFESLDIDFLVTFSEVLPGAGESESPLFAIAKELQSADSFAALRLLQTKLPSYRPAIRPADLRCVQWFFMHPRISLYDCLPLLGEACFQQHWPHFFQQLEGRLAAFGARPLLTSGIAVPKGSTWREQRSKGIQFFAALLSESKEKPQCASWMSLFLLADIHFHADRQPVGNLIDALEQMKRIAQEASFDDRQKQAMLEIIESLMLVYSKRCGEAGTSISRLSSSLAELLRIDAQWVAAIAERLIAWQRPSDVNIQAFIARHNLMCEGLVGDPRLVRHLDLQIVSMIWSTENLQRMGGFPIDSFENLIEIYRTLLRNMTVCPAIIQWESAELKLLSKAIQGQLFDLKEQLPFY